MDVKTILQSLLDHEVKFLVIGAWALPAYGYERFTRDLDILFEPTEENARRVVAALQAVGYDGIQDIPLDTILTKKVLLRDFAQQADTHPSVAGVSFAEAWASRVQTTMMGLKVDVPSLDVLIAMKRAAGRPQDMVDLERLEKLKAERATRADREANNSHQGR